ncbi:MAG: signal recognition particle-docking protein FtsY [Thermoplasmata archaeon]|nr:signal recognition particle-docking protein FtsY [Thermoplasmata archaeon]
MLESLKSKFKAVISRTKTEAVEKTPFADGVLGWKIKEEKLDEILDELELELLSGDVALEVVEAIKKKIKENLTGKRIKFGEEIEAVVKDALRNALVSVMTLPSVDIDNLVKKKKPFVIMFVGVNGTGKTTAIAKIANYLMKQGKTCVIAAGDTFRAGAIEQIEIHANKLGVKLVKHASGSDPAAVAFDAIEHARARERDVVLIDTAGRMQTNTNLMEEMKKIKRVAKPDLVIFVGDALAGNDAIEQARKFNAEVGVDCAILTKIDADAKGGAALSIAYAIKKPILFLSNGQGYDDIIKFKPEWLVNKILSEG